METQARRASDALRAVDGVVDSYLRHSDLGGRRIANLAATIAIENSGAGWGSLLLDEGEGLHPTLAIHDDLTAPHPELGDSDLESVQRAEETAELVVQKELLAAPIILDGKVKGVLYLRDFDDPPEESVQKLASSVASRIASLLRNAELLEALARSNEDLDALARLSEELASGHPDDRQLNQAVEQALRGTASESGVLGLFSQEGKLESCFSAGVNKDTVVADLLLTGVSPEDLSQLEDALPGSVLFEPLSADALHRRSRSEASGFLTVFRPTTHPYKLSEGSFLRSIANLLSGALARRDYFRKASEDELTATGSRFALQLALAEAEARSLKTGLPFSLILADIDHFKDINDEYGHLIGDEVLKDVAEVLRGRLRALDSVSRYGGDEFVVVLPDTGIDAAVQLATQLCELTRDRKREALAQPISLSVGVAEYDPDHTPADVLHRADRALYRSKHQGRDQVTRYSSDMQ